MNARESPPPTGTRPVLRLPFPHGGGVGALSTQAGFPGTEGREVAPAAAGLRVALGAGPGAPVACMRQVHGTDVIHVDARGMAAGAVAEVGTGDAMLASAPGVILVVRTADCVPLVLASRTGRLVGVIHAGWRGLMHDVVGAAVRAAAARGEDPGDLLLTHGPHAQQPSYEISQELADEFEERWGWLGDGGEGFLRGRLLDLGALARFQAIEAGVVPALIETCPYCTVSDTQWASYRRDGAGRGQVLTAAWLLGRYTDAPHARP